MDKWEYCDVTIRVEGKILGPKKWFGDVVIYDPKGKHRADRLATEFDYDPDQPVRARDAMGQVLAALGSQGWEIVRYQGSPDAQSREAFLKRRSSS